MAKKSFKKFAGTGKLRDVIQSRRTHQKQRKLVEGREKQKAAKKAHAPKGHGAPTGGSDDDEAGEDDDEVETEGKGRKGKKVAGVEDESFMGEELDDDAADGEQADDDDDEDAAENDTDDDFAELDDIEELEKNQKEAMANLAKTDPEFFKYLQENDKDLLEFGNESAGESSEGESVPVSKKAAGKKGKKAPSPEADMEELSEYEAPDSDDESEPEMDLGASSSRKGKGREEPEVVTMELLKQWQKGMVQKRSLKSLRRCLLAFRAAAYNNNEAQTSSAKAQTFAYEIDDPAVFSKLLLTTLHYTPTVLGSHAPFTTNAKTGRPKFSKAPPPALMKMVLSYMGNLIHLIGTLPDVEGVEGLVGTCVRESARMVPWIIGGRKVVRAYLKMLLENWSTGSDSVRIACFLAIRKLVAAGDEGVRDMVLKGLYLTLLRSCKATSVHTLPAINLMKNSASEVYTIDQATAYGHAFGYIRQLAVHLRNSIKTKTKDAYKAVYNWQFVHCIDFWSLVLSTACSREAKLARGGGESELQPLIYPLVQIALGVIRLIPTSRFFPLRFQVIRSLLRLTAQTRTYIPLAPSLLEPLSSSEFTQKPKPSSLTPLDFEYAIRAGAQYPRTRVYQEGLGEELAFLMLEHQALLSTSIAYPELSLPVTLYLRKFVKKCKTPRVTSAFKLVIEKMELNSKWVADKRKQVEFSPRDRAGVDGFLEDVSVEATPLGIFWKLQKKVRDNKRREVEKAAREERGPEEDGSEDDEGEGAFEVEDDEDEDELELEDDE